MPRIVIADFDNPLDAASFYKAILQPEKQPKMKELAPTKNETPVYISPHSTPLPPTPPPPPMISTKELDTEYKTPEVVYIQRKLKKSEAAYLKGEILHAKATNEKLDINHLCEKYSVPKETIFNLMSGITFKDVKPISPTDKSYEQFKKQSEAGKKRTEVGKKSGVFRKMTDEEKKTITRLMANGASALQLSKQMPFSPCVIQNVFKSAVSRAGISLTDRRRIIEWASTISEQKHVSQ